MRQHRTLKHREKISEHDIALYTRWKCQQLLACLCAQAWACLYYLPDGYISPCSQSVSYVLTVGAGFVNKVTEVEQGGPGGQVLNEPLRKRMKQQCTVSVVSQAVERFSPTCCSHCSAITFFFLDVMPEMLTQPNTQVIWFKWGLEAKTSVHVWNAVPHSGVNCTWCPGLTRVPRCHGRTNDEWWRGPWRRPPSWHWWIARTACQPSEGCLRWWCWWLTRGLRTQKKGITIRASLITQWVMMTSDCSLKWWRW